MSTDNDIILMGHGGGGALTSGLISDIIRAEIDNDILAGLDDAAALSLDSTDVVMTTDSFVVDPLFFPEGDIGRLAVCGTVNDIAMQGGIPQYLSLGLIIEEGLAVSDLKKIMVSIGATCREADVLVVTGDTKVVQRGGGDKPGIFINTTGIGERIPGIDVSVTNARPSDTIIVTGTIADHGVAVMNERNHLGMQSGLASDAAPLGKMVRQLLEAVPSVRCLRDPTRGGAAAALCDIAGRSGHDILLSESDLPVASATRGACDILGLEPLNVANEGKAIVVCPAADAETALTVLHNHPLGKAATIIGEVLESEDGMVMLKTLAGGKRIVDVPAGEDLPRIC